MSTLSVLSIVTDSWKNLEIWKGGKKLPALCALSLFLADLTHNLMLSWINLVIIVVKESGY